MSHFNLLDTECNPPVVHWQHRCSQWHILELNVIFCQLLSLFWHSLESRRFLHTVCMYSPNKLSHDGFAVENSIESMVKSNFSAVTLTGNAIFRVSIVKFLRH